MPCTYYLPGEEDAVARLKAEQELEKVKKTKESDKVLNHALSVALDETSELALLLFEYVDTQLPDDVLMKVDALRKCQIEHRKDDLNRLVKAFAKNPTEKNKERLKKVLDADPTKPLEPQLGFNPDDY